MTATRLNPEYQGKGSYAKVNAQYHSSGEALSVYTTERGGFFYIRGAGNSNYYVGAASPAGITKIASDGTYDSGLSFEASTGTLSFPTSGYYYWLVIHN